MNAKSENRRLNGPELIDLDPNTGRILDEDEDVTGLENDQEKLLDDIIGEFGAGDNEISYSASITRIPKNFQRGQKEPWLFECDASEIIGIRTKLRDIYRGGQFRIRVYRTTARGKKLYRQMDYYIESPAMSDAATGDAKVDAIAAALERTQATMLELAQRLSNPPSQLGFPQADPFQMMERMSVIMKNMQPTVSQAAHDNSFSMKDGMELFTKGMELAENMRGDGGDSWISVFKEMAKQLPVGEILQNLTAIKNQQPNMQRRQLPVPGQFQQRQPQNIPMPDRPMGEPQNPAATGQQLEQSMRYLITKAQRNANPELYAEWLLDNADKSLIRQMAHDANVLDQLAVIFPALTQPLIRAWFSELVAAMQEMLAQSNENEDTGEGIVPQSDQNGHDAGASRDFAPHTGRGGRDQGDPENHAGFGEGGPP